MKPSKINHPLRTIHFAYRTEADLTDFEKDLIERYTALHDGVWKLKEHLLSLRSDVMRKQQEMKIPTQGFERVNSIMDEISFQLGLSEKGHNTESKEYIINLKEFQKELNALNAQAEEYWKDIKILHPLYLEAFRMTDELDKEFEEFEKKYSNPLFRNFEKAEIDTNRYDSDLDDFKKLRGEIFEQFDKTTDQYEEWLAVHNKLEKNIKTLYDRVKRTFDFLRQQQGQNKDSDENQFSSN